MTPSVDTQSYSGSLLAADLLSSDTTLVLNAFGPVQSGQTLDAGADGRLTLGEGFTLDGGSYTLLGSGTLTPAAVSLLGATLGLGTPVDVILAEDSTTGDLVFLYPDGPPDTGAVLGLAGLLGSVTTVLSLSPVGYDFTTGMPICYVAGTRLRTPGGWRAIETLAPGDLVCDRDGGVHPVLWVGRSEFGLRAPSRARLRPVIVAAGAFGPGSPARPLRLSPQHRVEVTGGTLDLLFGLDRALAPIGALVNGRSIRIDTEAETVVYLHLLLPEHALLDAEGLAAESLLMGPEARRSIAADMPEEGDALFPEVGERFPDASRRPCLPVLRWREACLLAQRPTGPASARARVSAPAQARVPGGADQEHRHRQEGEPAGIGMKAAKRMAG